MTAQEYSGTIPGLIQEGARTALSARYFGEIIEIRGHGCPRSVRKILESGVGIIRFARPRNDPRLSPATRLIA